MNREVYMYEPTTKHGPPRFDIALVIIFVILIISGILYSITQ